MSRVASDSTTRFSSRVTDYVSSRPSYPAEVVTLLSSQFNLQPNSTIVDIGSGTGISAAFILDKLHDKGVKVIGIEPNKEMREAGDQMLSPYREKGLFSSRDGTAENTGVEEKSVDLVIAAQAFHWFDVPKAREECKRILKDNGRSGVALIWNERIGLQPSTSDENSIPRQLDKPVMSAYDLLLIRRANDYEQVSHHKVVGEDLLKEFFGGSFATAKFPNPYRLDYEQLKGRLLSSSYTPQQGDEGYETMMQELRELFDKYQYDGKIDFHYDTRVFYGSMS